MRVHVADGLALLMGGYSGLVRWIADRLCRLVMDTTNGGTPSNTITEEVSLISSLDSYQPHLIVRMSRC